MKTRILLAFSVLAIAITVLAVPSLNTAALNFTFSYDFAGNPDLAHFNLYTGLSSSNYTSKISLGTSTNSTVAGLPRNTVFFCNVTAVSTNGVESDYTTEQVIKTWNKPKPAIGFQATQTQ